MGDLLGSLVQGSQKRTILCIIGVGCYTALASIASSLVPWAVICVRTQLSRSNACINAFECMTCVRTQSCDLATHQFCINRTLSPFL
jgi:hypothetical protein